MTTELTPSQLIVLQRLPARITTARIDRLWIFPPHSAKGRETGFLVLSMLPDAEQLALPHLNRFESLRGIVTIRYDAEIDRTPPRVTERAEEEGWAPPERVERVIAGVAARAESDSTEPAVEEIGGSPARWDELTARLGLLA